MPRDRAAPFVMRKIAPSIARAIGIFGTEISAMLGVRGSSLSIDAPDLLERLLDEQASQEAAADAEGGEESFGCHERTLTLRAVPGKRAGERAAVYFTMATDTTNPTSATP